MVKFLTYDSGSFLGFFVNGIKVRGHDVVMKNNVSEIFRLLECTQTQQQPFDAAILGVDAVDGQIQDFVNRFGRVLSIGLIIKNGYQLTEFSLMNTGEKFPLVHCSPSPQKVQEFFTFVDTVASGRPAKKCVGPHSPQSQQLRVKPLRTHFY